jgi:acid phosphatase type 7
VISCLGVRSLGLPRRGFVLLIAVVALASRAILSAEPPAHPDPNPTIVFSQFAAGEPIRFVAYGDSRFTDPWVTAGTNPRVRMWLASRIGEEHARVVLLTGDTPYHGAKETDWQEFQKETASWRAQHMLELPTTGNHEVYGGYKEGIANYLANFPAIEGHRYYSALLGSVEVISLDCTGQGAASQPQARWFAAQLDHLPRQVQFLLILYHIPWVADPQTRLLLNVPSGNALVLRDILEARLHRIQAKVVVFNGHLHNYERFVRNGVEYVVTGGGGAEPYPILIRGRSDLYRDTAFPVYHYLTVDIENGKLHAVMWKIKNPDAHNLTVEAKDEFTLIAPPLKPASNVPAKPPARLAH